MNYAIIVDGVVVNVIVWDGDAPFTADGSLVLIPDDVPAGIDWTWDGSNFTAPPVPQDELS